MIIFFLVACGTTLFVMALLNVSRMTDEEKMLDDIAQAEYLKNWKKSKDK